MVMDVIVGLIVVGFMAWGIKKGFVYTFLTTIDWILALVAAFLWSSKVAEFLAEKTPIYEKIYEKLLAKFTESAANATTCIDSLPTILGDALVGARDKMTAGLAEVMAERVFAILCFALVVIAVKIAIFIIIHLLSKRNNQSGVVGFADGLAGMVTGFAKGMIVVFMLFALMVPVMNMFFPEHIEAAMKALETSRFAGDLYNNNLLLLIVRDFMHFGA